MTLQACGPVKPPLAGEASLCIASQAGSFSDPLLRTAVPPGAPAPTAQIMRLPAQETPCSRRPPHSEPSGDNVVPRLSEGICHKTWWAGRRAPRQLARCCQAWPCPQVFKPFSSFAASFLLPLLGAINSFFFFFSISFCFHQLPCFGSWQTKLLSPLITKVRLFRLLKASVH